MDQEGIGAAAEHPGNRILYIPDSTALSPPELAASFDSQSPRSAIIQQIADIITTAPDLSQASLPFLNAIQKLVDCQIASIYAINEATNVVTALLFASTLPIQRKTADTWPFSGNALELHLKLGYPHIQDLELDHPYPGSHKYLEAGIKRTLWAPLTHQGQTIGLIVLRSTKPDAFDYNHLASISRLATLIAPSVEETIKLWEARQELQSTQALNQSRESLSDVVDYRQALELICQKCCELLASHYAILAEVEGDELVYRWAWLSWASGPFQPDEKEARCSLKQSNPGLAARVALSGQPEVINYVAETPRKDLDLELLGFPDVTSIMAVPMVESGRVIGVLITGYRGTNQRFVNRYLLAAEAFAAHAATTLQNARLQQAAQRHSAEIALADEVSRILTSTLNIDEVYDRFADEVKKLVDFDRMNVHTVNAADGTYTIKYLSGLVQTGRHSGDTWPLEGTQTQQVVETGQTSIVYDHAIDPKFRYDRELLQVGLRSRISLPLTSRGAVIGTLALHSRRVGAYGPREQAILERLAHLIGPAIENARLHQAAQDYAAEITLVAEISRIITSTLNIDEVYEKFAQEVKKLVDFDRMNIHVIDGADGAFTIRHLSGPAEDGHRSGDVVPLEGTQTQQVIETGQPAITHDYAVESRFLYDRALLQSGLRSRICLPLSGRGNIIGSLTLHSRRVGAYGPREQAILERLAHQIGPAIENARLYEQVRLQAQLIDNVSESVVAKDLEGRVTYWNKGAQALYGYSAQEVLGFPITFIVKPEEAEEEQQRMQQALADGSWRGQYLQQRKDGAAIWTYTSISLVQDSQGNPSGFIRIDRDITQQRENVEALRRSEAQQRAILEAIPDAMFRLSGDGTYLDYTAPQGFDFILPPEEFLGRTINEVMPPELGRQIMSDLRHTFQTGQAQTFEYQLIQDGRQRDYEARLVVIREDEVLAMVREVTERKLLEAQLFQSQKMESLGRLVGGVAHDFNNILGGIMGYASLLKTRLAPDTDSYEFAQIIETATRRGAQLTQQLLTASRKSAPQLVPMDVNEAVAEVAQILSRTLPRNVTVIEQLQPLLPHIEGDLTQIHQVLMNLCINAADAMPQGGDLTLSTRSVFLGQEHARQHPSLQSGRYVRLSVADTGVGISEENLPKIFEPFFTTKETGKGTGLGLSVVYGIVKNHHGAIEAASKMGQGSVFTVYLPVYRGEG